MRCFEKICFDGTDFWISERKRLGLIRWNIHKGILGEYDGTKLVEESYIMGNMHAFGDKIWILPSTYSKTLCFDKRNNTWEVVNAFDNYKVMCQKDRPLFVRYVLCKDGIFYCLVDGENIILEYNVKTGAMKEYSLKIDDENALEQMKREYLLAKKVVNENRDISLDDLISVLRSDYAG